MYYIPYEEISRIDVLPISLAYTKQYLHIDEADTAHDETITRMLRAARDYFEGATNRSLTEITYKTYANTFTFRCFELRKKPIMEISSVEYYDTDEVLQTIAPADYFLRPMNGYDLLVFKDAFIAPALSTDCGWPIIITFKSGYGNVEDVIPEGIEDGLLAHVAKMFENRGDAFETTGSVRRFVPTTTRLEINNYKIEEIGA